MSDAFERLTQTEEQHVDGAAALIEMWEKQEQMSAEERAAQQQLNIIIRRAKEGKRSPHSMKSLMGIVDLTIERNKKNTVESP